VQPVGGIENAPAPPGDLLVRQTVDLVQKLPLAAPGVDQVGVRVAERRKEHAPCRVDDLVGGDVAQRVHASERRETAVFSQQPQRVERAQLVHVGAAAAQTARRFDADDAGDVLHQQSHRPRRNRTEASIWGYDHLVVVDEGNLFAIVGQHSLQLGRRVRRAAELGWPARR